MYTSDDGLPNTRLRGVVILYLMNDMYSTFIMVYNDYSSFILSYFRSPWRDVTLCAYLHYHSRYSTGPTSRELSKTRTGLSAILLANKGIDLTFPSSVMTTRSPLGSAFLVREVRKSADYQLYISCSLAWRCNVPIADMIPSPNYLVSQLIPTPDIVFAAWGV